MVCLLEPGGPGNVRMPDVSLRSRPPFLAATVTYRDCCAGIPANVVPPLPRNSRVIRIIRGSRLQACYDVSIIV